MNDRSQSTNPSGPLVDTKWTGDQTVALPERQELPRGIAPAQALRRSKG